MLRDNYAEDKLFAEILELIPAMEPVLAKVDWYLQDDEFFQLVGADLSKRYAKTLETGRDVCDSLGLRQFCRVYLNRVFADGTVAESNIHPPSDNRQMADSVLVLERAVNEPDNYRKLYKQPSRKRERISLAKRAILLPDIGRQSIGRTPVATQFASPYRVNAKREISQVRLSCWEFCRYGVFFYPKHHAV